MARPIKFDGCNLHLLPPDGAENVEPMHAFTNGTTVVECWELTAEEIQEVARTGCIWLSLFGQHIPPIFVGSEETVRDIIADYGVWKKP